MSLLRCYVLLRTAAFRSACHYASALFVLLHLVIHLIFSMVVTKIQQNYRLNHQTLQHESYSRILSALVRPMSRLLLRCQRSCCLYRIRLRCYRHSMVGLTFPRIQIRA